MPIFTVVAGANGAGKSTLTKLGRDIFQDSAVLDPDAIAKRMAFTGTEPASDIEAGREVLRLSERYLQNGESFLVETTLSGNTYLRMMLRAKALGYFVRLYYVGTDSVEINLGRVKSRVVQGGHDVPEADQRRRYPRSLDNFAKAWKIADEAIVFDNSGRSHRTIAVKRVEGLEVRSAIPDWAAFLRPN